MSQLMLDIGWIHSLFKEINMALNAASGVLKTVVIAPETTWGVSPAGSSSTAKYARRTTCDL